MPQVSKNPPKKEINDRIFELFIKILKKSVENNQAIELVDSLFTPTEKTMLAKRISITYMLAQDYDYRTISQILKVSTSTVGIIGSTYKHSPNFKAIVDKLLEDEETKQFWRDVAVKTTGILAIPRNKTGIWKELNKQSKVKQKPF